MVPRIASVRQKRQAPRARARRALHLARGVLKELDLKQGSAFVRHDLIIFPLHDECWHGDALQVLSEVRFGERLDAIVVGLGPAHHALAPPILDNTIQRLGHRDGNASRRQVGSMTN
jgi:hypothetical protein